MPQQQQFHQPPVHSLDGRPPLARSVSVPLILVDCLAGTIEHITYFPYVLHETDITGQAVSAVFHSRQGSIVLTPPESGLTGSVFVNGIPLSAAVSLPRDETFSLQIGRRLLLLQAAPPPTWPPGFNAELWQVFDTETGELLGEAPPRDILKLAAEYGWDPSRCAVCPEGLETGFFLASAADTLTASDNISGNTPDRGRFLCPACWLRFDAGDALAIATHESLRSDPVLGADIMLRFNPTRFNDFGQAVDPMGLPATELACPHCRRQLPPGYLDLPHQIISLIGAPSSGKSYFLAVLTRMLQERLSRDFNLVFKDGDPTGNMLLNQMRTKLFSGATPEECVLGKTAMEGATYERLPRFGRWVALPRPFIYVLSDEHTRPPHNSAVIFYDNAGEHFEPGHSIDDSPGALHVVRSSGIFFLYDPTSSVQFRKELTDVPDPQLRQHGRADQQDTILAEMEVRVKKMLGLAPGEKIPIPIAVLVGKCDVWAKLLDARALPRPISNGKLDSALIDANSALVRGLLDRLCPGLVAHAESLSESVRYFAVSSLGHSPSALEGGPNAGLLAPDPEKLEPIGIEIPAYWLFNKIMPDIIPSVGRE
ncbi:MAG: hypothetical protein LBV54_06055 [Puniceicoccales bacterium]|jgi:hypothetical protein|nr:hypothetical protein [Puniceicoccales bacterium]